MTSARYDPHRPHPCDTAASTRVCGSGLVDQSPRTLVWGYNKSFHSFHVYLDEQGRIHKVVYAHTGKVGVLLAHQTQDDITEAAEYVPNKWMYPEACDQQFCEQLVSQGVTLPVVIPDRGVRPTPLFHGARLEQLVRRD